MAKSMRMRWAGHLERMGERRNTYTILVGKPKRKRPLGRPGRRRKNKMDLREIRLEGMDWIHLAQDMGRWRAVVKTVMNLRFP
jgi:hypothetical protein